MEKMTTLDVVALGELLIDFTSNGVSPQGNPIFEANPGGAPCNALAMLNSLGYQTGFIGKVGEDMFGKILQERLVGLGIDIAGLVMDSTVGTTLAFVHTAPDGDRDFSFYRKPGADMMLYSKELQPAWITRAKIFHFGSLSLTHEPARTSTKEAVKIAKENGLIISFDPNYRAPLWQNEQDAVEQILWGCGQCDVMKIAEEEVKLITGESDLEQGVQKLRQQFPQIRLLMATCGKQGATAYYENISAHEPTFLEVKTIETTGAGDTFCGCCLGYVRDHGLSGLTEFNLHEMLRYANGASSLITTRKGALCVMPSKEEIAELLAQ